MAKPLPISRGQFQGRAWLKPDSLAFAAQQTFVPLLAAEFGKAAVAMPIVFVEEAGKYLPVALMSLIPGSNLFVGPQGQWLGTYLPARLRIYPFLFARSEGTDEMTFCIDDESGLIVSSSDPKAQAFFQPDGNLGSQMQGVFELLTQIEGNRVITESAMAALAEAGVIQPWQIVVEIDGETKGLQGLYRIDEAALAAVDDEVFLELRRSGALPLAYLQMVSQSQMALFEMLIAQRGHSGKPASNSSIPGNNDIAAMEELFAQIDPKGDLFG